MPTDTENLHASIGLMRRELRDTRSIVAALDQRSRRQEPSANRTTPHRLLAQLLTCHVMGRRNARPAASTVAELYGNDAALLDALARPGMIGKAASAPATTTVTAWAGEFGTPAVDDLSFLQLLTPESVYSQLSGRPGAIRVSLAGYSSVKVPTRAPTPTLGAPFIAEGAAIPVKGLSMSAATLSPRKCGLISTFTNEMLKHTSIERLISVVMAFDTATAVDGVLLGAGAATAIQPAGILNGVVATTASVTTGLAGFAADVRALAAAVEATGPLLDPVLIMSTTSALMIDVLSLGGASDVPIISSPNVPAKRMILLDAANFASGEGDEPDITSSNEVLLHEEDTNPAAISTVGTPNVFAAPTRSMFQTACVAIRLIQDLAWVLTRTGRIAYADNVSW